MTIILDLDDVLANLRESLYQTMSRVTGIDNHWRDWTHYDLREHFEMDTDALEDVLSREQALESCDPEPGAADATLALHDLGFEIAIVTARGWHPQAHELTAVWLDKHGVTHHHLHVVPLGGNKIEAIEPFDNIVLAVDDHPNNVRRFQQANIPTLMMDRPWNADYASAERIFSLDAVIDYASDLANNSQNT